MDVCQRTFHLDKTKSTDVNRTAWASSAYDVTAFRLFLFDDGRTLPSGRTARRRSSRPRPDMGAPPSSRDRRGRIDRTCNQSSRARSFWDPPSRGSREVSNNVRTRHKAVNRPGGGGTVSVTLRSCIPVSFGGSCCFLHRLLFGGTSKKDCVYEDEDLGKDCVKLVLVVVRAMLLSLLMILLTNGTRQTRRANQTIDRKDA